MANYNFIERNIAKLLARNPAIKNFAKILYQKLSFLIYKKPFNFNSDYKIEMIDSTESESFFGYYDNNPRNGDLELYHISDIPTSIKPSDSLSMNKNCFVVVKSLLNDEIKYKTKTLAFNWQQGSKLQWVSKSSFIFNDVIKGEIKSKLVDLNDNSIRVFDDPVYDCFEDQFYLSLDYRPLTKLRPDYAYFKKGDWENVDFKYQSIKKVYLNGSNDVVVDLLTILDKFPLDVKCDYKSQKFNHIMISKDGSKAIFLHRYYTSNGVRNDRLFSVSLTDHYELKMISDSGMISHYCWVDKKTILAYMKHNNTNGYYFIDIDSICFTRIDIEELNNFGDGHPTYIGDGKFITDTYPDKSRTKSLLLVDTNNKSVKVLAQFFESFIYRDQTRCDLHPKWDPINNYIYIDSVHEGARKLYKIGMKNDY
ncbi:hypothetical protein ACOX9X_10635 [Photobacterium leiognathi subsp. mandapamensis]|uniref:hypothetical protein n=1 Tax=Photobacterium leiognathi TaxID=553611 RepID=UPI003BF54148